METPWKCPLTLDQVRELFETPLVLTVRTDLPPKFPTYAAVQYPTPIKLSSFSPTYDKHKKHADNIDRFRKMTREDFEKIMVMTREDAAKQLGCSPPTLSRYARAAGISRWGMALID